MGQEPGVTLHAEQDAINRLDRKHSRNALRRVCLPHNPANNANALIERPFHGPGRPSYLPSARFDDTLAGVDIELGR